jgi:uncharacterized protein YybS (DUF2232 family)
MVVVLLSFMTPFIIFTISFLMVPVLVLYVTQSTRSFVIYYLVSLLIVYVISAWQGPFLLAVSLFFLPPVLVMGNLYKKKAAARSVLTAGAITLLAESLLSLIITNMFGLKPIANFKQMMLEYIESMPKELMVLVPKDIDTYLNIIVQIMPLYLFSFAMFYAFVTHGVSRWLLNKTGKGLPGLPPLREMRLPKSLVWIYLIAFAIDMFMEFPLGSLLSTLLLNMLPLLMLAFTIQALSFLFFVAHANRWNRAMPITAIVVLIIFSPLMVVYSLLGVFDVAFPIRERFKKNN